MLDWLMNLISSIISFIMGLFGLGGTEKKVRFEDEESAAAPPSADAVAAVLAGPAETPTTAE
jgi:hypothetical protein